MNKLIASTLLALAACTGALASCSATQIKQDAKVGITAGIECVKTDIGQVLKDNGLTVLGDVMQVLLAGGDGWQAEVAKVGALFGDAVEACAVKAALAAFDAQFSTSSGTSSTPASRARALIVERQWTYK